MEEVEVEEVEVEEVEVTQAQPQVSQNPLDETISNLNQAVSNNPKEPLLFIALSKAKLASGDVTGAVDAATRAINTGGGKAAVAAMDESLRVVILKTPGLAKPARRNNIKPEPSRLEQPKRTSPFHRPEQGKTRQRGRYRSGRRGHKGHQHRGGKGGCGCHGRELAGGDFEE